MDVLLSTLATSIIIGSLYALIALGYTMVYGILKFINFAHSDVVVVGAWLSLTLARRLHAEAGHPGWWVGPTILVTAMVLCAALGFLIEYLAYRPLRKAPRLNCLITAIGVSLLLQNLGQLDKPIPGTSWRLGFGAQPQAMPELLPNDPLLQLHYGEQLVTLVTVADVFIFFGAVALMIGLQTLVFRTRLGLAMRAVSFSPDHAALMGIPVDRVISFTFSLGAMLAAAAGFLYVHKYPQLSQPADAAWVVLGLKAFVAAVVGGIGNFRGAVLGGFVIAAIEQFGSTYISTSLREVYMFTILILVLLFRPAGLLGTPAREKV